MARRYRAVVEYDGAAYAGFQRQANQPTVQSALEQAIERTTGQNVVVLGSGRTDAGVHARGQAIAFDVAWRHGVEALQRALNARLPADISILSLAITKEDFHPRFDACKRTYLYTINNEPVRSPLHRRASWHVRRPLDLAAMNEAASALVGVHDFGTFGRPPKGENTVRQVYEAFWRRQRALLLFQITANAFLYRMVRSLVGSMKLVGEGTWTASDFVAALEACDRSRAGTTAPPHGLTLLSVTYDECV